MSFKPVRPALLIKQKRSLIIWKEIQAFRLFLGLKAALCDSELTNCQRDAVLVLNPSSFGGMCDVRSPSGNS